MACVATEYGETLLPDADNVTVRSGRIPVSEIIQLLSDTKYDLVIDATHPYAASITESVARACAETGTEYLSRQKMRSALPTQRKRRRFFPRQRGISC